MANRISEQPPKDWKPTQAVPDPIINNPYEEPKQHWLYRDGAPEQFGERRRAQYYFKEKRVGSAQQELFREENAEDLPLVNALRDDVRRWRGSGYRGASHITKELLQYWTREDRHRRLFFCQREAVETIIYLLELGIPGKLSKTKFQNFEVDANDISKLLRGEKPSFETLATQEFFPRLIDPAADPELLALRRLGCKMATGSGKTIVMAMLIAWAFCNRAKNPASRHYPNAVVVCAPNLTVRSRLQVLKPEDPGNYYDDFDIVPSRFREYLNTGKVLVTNWHRFAPKSEHSEGGKSYRVVDKGEEPSDAFTKDRLGDLVSRLPILVLNDEGHHCWRPKPMLTEKEEKEALKEFSKEEKETLTEDAEEARVWLAGLDRINNCGLLGHDADKSLLPGILTCVDLSATPFYLGNSGYPEGSPFPWLVSDFGLVDAIECGITKVPRLPVADDTRQTDDAGRPDPKYFRLWENIKNSCTTSEKIRNTPKPEAAFKYAEDALVTLASQWKVQFEEARKNAAGKDFIPPVMIVVCDNTDIAEIAFEKISGETEVSVPDPENPKKTITQKRYDGSSVFEEFSNTEDYQRTIRIDTKLLAKVEKEEGETRDQAALRLRELIDTVGKRGGLGEHIRCVVSVSMLTEGWDANNVTHILGIRAFKSQLLCEQVVGRGLRRMSYTPDPETGLLPAEYVDVYGIPFSLIPYKGKPKEKEPRPDPVYHSIFAMDERKDFEIRVPEVQSYVYELREHGIRCDIESLDELVVDQTPGEVWLRPTRGYHDDSAALSNTGDYVKQTREQYYETIRPQQIVFRISQMVMDDLMNGAQAADERTKAELQLKARHQLFPEIVSIVQQYIQTKVILNPGLDRRELGLEIYATKLVTRIRDNILPAASEEGKLIAVTNRFRPHRTTTDVIYQTTRPVVDLTKSHLNRAMIQSTDEAHAVEVLEELDFVEFYAPNDERGVGLGIPYEYDEEIRHYIPDFLIRLRGSVNVMLEIKGLGGRVYNEDLVPAKNAAARKWCSAVSNLGRYGKWEFEICDEIADLRAILAKHADHDAGLPFEIVDATSAEPWKTCVPLTSLRIMATNSEKQQLLAGGSWTTDLIQWDGQPEFETGMFVAKVHGDAMEPSIPAGSYCLFRPTSSANYVGKVLFIKHSGIIDPHTGGNWTIRTVESIEHAGTGDKWGHDRVVLSPESGTYPSFTLELKSHDDLQVLGEFVSVIPSPACVEGTP